MILLAALVVMQAAPGAVAPEDVVVTARRREGLKRLRMTIRRDRNTGASRCVFRRRSGDASLDAIVCDAAMACVPQVQTSEDARRCMAPTLDSLVENGVPWRVQAKGTGQ